MSLDKEIIDLKLEKPDEGEIRYTYSSKPPKGNDPVLALAKRVLGVLIGVSVFALLIFFFVYVILPIIAIVLIWVLLKGLFRKA